MDTRQNQISQLDIKKRTLLSRRGLRGVAGAVTGPMKRRILRLGAKLRILIIGSHCAALLSNTENGLLLVPASDMMVGRRLCFNGSYDLDLLTFLLGHCNSQSNVLFVGAHVGSLAIPVARRVKKVVAIEANPVTFELLRMNVVLNGLQNVELFNFAAGDRNADVAFLASELNSGGSSIEMNDGKQEEAHIYGNPGQIKVLMKPLDQVFPHACFDLIVMDIEGAETLALKGMDTLIKRSRGLLVEVFEHHLRRIARVSNEEFLSLVEPHYDEAFILPEKPGPGEPISCGPYPRSAFAEMMVECCRRGMTNVMFLNSRVSAS